MRSRLGERFESSSAAEAKQAVGNSRIYPDRAQLRRSLDERAGLLPAATALRRARANPGAECSHLASGRLERDPTSAASPLGPELAR